MEARVLGGVYLVKWLSNHLPTLRVRPVRMCHLAMDIAIPVTVLSTAETKPSKPIAIKEYDLTHRRFGHMDKHTIRKLHTVTDHKQVHILSDLCLCTICQVGKMREHINHVVAPRRDEPLNSVSLDIAGPEVISVNGNRCFAILVDNATRMKWVIPLGDRKSIL